MKHKQIITILSLNLLILITSFTCNNAKSDDTKTPLARVYDKFLYKEDIAKIIPKHASKQDSIDKIKSFVEFWVKEQALTKTAEFNLPEDQKNVANELERYRMTLLIERYKRSFLAQNLDTLITKQQIQDFYDKHKEEFRLTQAAVKVDYIRVLTTAPNISMIKNLYRSNREKDKLKVKKYCSNHAALYNNFNDDWIFFKDLSLTVPFEIDNIEKYLKLKKNIEVSDSIYLYLVNIRNYRLKGAVSPLKFVEGNIQSMLLNQRKRLLIDSLQTNIYNNMIDKKEIEMFE